MNRTARLALACVLAGAASFAQTPSRTPDVPFVPTSQELVVQMLKLANVSSKDVVYDLGCGDGRIVITAAKDFGAHAVGVDINPERIKEATENARKAGVTTKVNFVEGDLFTAEIKPASVVTLYLLPNVNMRLRPRLFKELKPGTRVVSHSFDMEDWKPDKEIDVNGSRLYLWTIPAHGEAHGSK